MEDHVGDRHLAHVVQEKAELHLGVGGELRIHPPGQLEPVGGHPRGVGARVGVARLHGVGERPHRVHVRAAQLLRARPLGLEGLAEVGCVALELLLLVLRLPALLLRVAAEARRARRSNRPPCLLRRSGPFPCRTGYPCGPPSTPAGFSRSWLSAASTASAASSIDTARTSVPARPSPAASPSVKSSTVWPRRRPRRSSAAHHGLGAADAGVHERHLEAPALTCLGRGGGAGDPLVVEAEPHQRRLEPGPDRGAAHHQQPRPARQHGGAESIGQLLGIDRLGHLPLAEDRLVVRDDRHHDHRSAAQLGVLAQFAEHVQPALPLHEDVEGQGVEAVAAEPLEGLRTARRDLRAHVVLGQVGGDHLGHLLLVVHHQDLRAADGLARSVTGVALGLGREAHGEGGALSHLAAHLDRAALQLHQRPHDREAEPGPRAPVVAADEAVEHVLEVLGAHPPAGVAHLQLDLRRGAVGDHGDPPVLLRVLVRVGDEVGHDLPHPHRVGEHEWQAGGQVQLEPLVLAPPPVAP